jgi:hypothetical protein
MQRKRNERPTVPPSFDVERYAKDSDERIRTSPLRADAGGDAVEPAASGEPTGSPQSETRIVTRPKTGAAITDEAWARKATGAPTIVLSSESLCRLPLDQRAGFLLSLMDGTMDLETIVEISTMPREEVLRIVRDLFESGVVAFR